MATRATISIKTPMGYLSVYSHWDGYIEYVGSLLYGHYNSQEMAEKLLAKCDKLYISSLGPTLMHTVFKAGTGARIIDDLFAESEEFNYVFQDGNWFVFEYGKSDLTLLSTFFEKDEKFEKDVITRIVGSIDMVDIASLLTPKGVKIEGAETNTTNLVIQDISTGTRYQAATMINVTEEYINLSELLFTIAETLRANNCSSASIRHITANNDNIVVIVK